MSSGKPPGDSIPQSGDGENGKPQHSIPEVVTTRLQSDLEFTSLVARLARLPSEELAVIERVNLILTDFTDDDTRQLIRDAILGPTKAISNLCSRMFEIQEAIRGLSTE